jgi:soluble lytic murein transglycosylase-like protein
MRCLFLLCYLMTASACSAGTAKESRQEAEYYVAAYARHYNMPVEFVRAVVEQESAWKRCVISSKGAVGLMQLMPATAARLKVSDRCDIRQNISGGVRYLAWLSAKFHRDLRLVAAAYYVGEHTIAMRGLNYANPDVVAYVASIRERIERQRKLRSTNIQSARGRTQ